MATPLTATGLVRALRAEGLRVVETPGWRIHNRNSKGPWGPTHGVMVHHTVTRGTAATVRICREGYSGLPGPLCHGVIAKDGTVYLIGNGRANHAGLGDDDVLRAVVAERGELPPPNENNTDGNRHFYGFECENLGNGEDPWPAEQLDAIAKAAAAVCRAHGWSERSVIAHKEWTNTKVDPRGFAMRALRAGIATRLDRNPQESGEGEQPPKERPKYAPYPGVAFFRVGRVSPLITAVGRRLVAEGCGRYSVGPGPEWSEADERSYAAWQRKLGYAGRDADGIPGKTSWDRLKVPNA